MARDERTLEPVPYYQKLPPDIHETEVLVIDTSDVSAPTVDIAAPINGATITSELKK